LDAARCLTTKGQGNKEVGLIPNYLQRPTLASEGNFRVTLTFPHAPGHIFDDDAWQ